jgi:hypothetical protein
MRIVLASLLNPPLHARMFYKEALTLQKAGYEVTVIGRNHTPEKTEFYQNGVHCIGLPYFKRSNFYARYQRKKEIQQLILSLNPDIVHIHTPELLPLCPILKKNKIKIVYDVHENYRKNIQSTKYYPFYLKPFVLLYLSHCEHFAYKYADAVIYAENSYQNYLNLSENKVFYVLNAYQPIEPATEFLLSFNANNYDLILLYTGTIAKEWGILNALQMWEKLQQKYKTALIIAGSGIFRELPLHKDIYLYPVENYLPYAHIVRTLEEISKFRHKVFGLMLYEPLPSIMECLPTKWFEFVYYRIPILYTDSSYWNSLNRELNFGLSDLEYNTISLPLNYYPLSDESYIPYTWDKQKETLLEVYQNLKN